MAHQNTMPFARNIPRDILYEDPSTMSSSVSVIVPSLDLTSLTMDDETDTAAKELRKHAVPKDDNERNAPREVNGGKEVLFKRQMMPFVFPSEKSFTDIDVIRGNSYSQNEDSYYITSVSSYRTNSLANEPGSGKEYGVLSEDGTISFSLSNPKFGKCMIDNGGPKAERKESIDHQVEKIKPAKVTTCSSGNKTTNSGASGDPLPSGQQVYDVIVVNGHFKHEDDVYDNLEPEVPHAEFGAEEECLTEKPKARVTFSFQDNGAPSGRYTPIKPDVRVQLQSVLKKRRTPSPVLHRSYSEDRDGGRRKHSPTGNKDSIRLFGSSYTLDYRFGCHTSGLEHGIPVKHIHTTNTDLESRQGRSTTNNMAEKPPPSTSANRITLSMAEKVATSGSVRGMPSRGNRLSASHTRGRMAYFRPSERGRATTTTQNPRSKSSDDMQLLPTRSNMPTSATNKNTKTNSTMPFSLRRCASSERDLIASEDNKRQRRKPKVAFGSFILPKESSSRIKPAQVQFHELNPAGAGIPLGTYVHTHTRRSPYAPPTQVLLNDHRRSEVVRRPGTSSSQARQLPQHPHHQQPHAMSSNKTHAQRHSAPSSFNSMKEKTFPAPQSKRISINTSPARPHFPRSTNETGPSLRPTHPGSSAGQGHARHSSGYPEYAGPARPKAGGVATDGPSNRQASIAELNAIANKDRGVSHHRFMTKLETYAKEGS